MSYHIPPIVSVKPANIPHTRDILSSDRYPWLVSSRTPSGVSVNSETALNLTAVFNAITLIANDVAAMECIVYRDKKDTREPAKDSPIYDLLYYQPNEEQTPVNFWQMVMCYRLRYGNAYAEIEFRNGKPVALWILPSDIVQVERNKQTKKIEYRMQGGSVTIPAERILHFRGLGSGLTGYSPIEICRDSLGLASGLDRYSASSVGNSFAPSGILRTPSELSDQARDNIASSIEAKHSGLENARRLMILEEGLDYQPFAFNQQEFDLVNQRRFSVEEIGRCFNINPILLQDMGRATWGNYSQVIQRHYDSTIRPYLIEIEQELERRLFSARERSFYFIEFSSQNLLRLDPETRMKIYDQALQNKVYTVDEVRAWENLNPLTEEQLAAQTPATIAQLPAPVIDTQKDLTPDNELPNYGNTNANATDSEYA